MSVFSYKAWLYAVSCVILLLFSAWLYANAYPNLNKAKVINALHEHYGERAAKRGRAWFEVLSLSYDLAESQKLENINNFFNLLYFIDDSKLWGKENYWATPVEFIGANGGDCEDFAIAKYFSLLELGVADEKMRIAMVKAVKLNQYHMVVAYYETPGSVPLILDNIDGVIKPASQRQDLIPVYSFNGKQLWLNKEKGQGVLAGKSQRLQRWTNLNQRIGLAKMRQPKLSME